MSDQASTPESRVQMMHRDKTRQDRMKTEQRPRYLAWLATQPEAKR